LGIDEEIKAIDQDSEKLESNNINNVSPSPNKNNQITPNNESEKVDGGGGEHDGDVNLVVDILNDELIAQVRQKIHSKRERVKFSLLRK
jgi:hypothetical protein